VGKQTRLKTVKKKQPSAEGRRRRNKPERGGEGPRKGESSQSGRASAKPEDELARIWDEDLCE